MGGHKEDIVSYKGELHFQYSQHLIVNRAHFQWPQSVSGEIDEFKKNMISIKKTLKIIEFGKSSKEQSDLDYCMHLSKIMKIIRSKLQKKKTSNEHELCWILFCSSVSISFITWSNIARSLKSWTILNSQQKGLLKNARDRNIQCIIG